MKQSTKENLSIFGFFGLLMALIGFCCFHFYCCGVDDGVKKMKQESLDLNYSEFDQRTGEWKWVIPAEKTNE